MAKHLRSLSSFINEGHNEPINEGLDIIKAFRVIWDGDGLDISKKYLSMTAIPLAQLLVTSHANELPTSEEFKNCCTWIASQGSEQLAETFMDEFKDVFFPGVIDSYRYAFLRKKIYNQHKDDRGLQHVESKLLKKWNVDEIPDYTEGIMILSKRYKDSAMGLKNS